MRKRDVGQWNIIYLFLIAFSVIALFPYFWMITCAVRNEADLFSIPPRLWVAGGSLRNFEYVMTKTRIPQYLLNSCFISIMSTFMCLFASVPAGYALARFHFRARSAVSSGVLLFKLLPQTAALIPLYMLMIETKMMDTHFGLSFVHLLVMVPFSIWMTRGFIKTVPVSIEEAALIDGCNKPQMLLHVMLPTIAPGLFAVGIYAFMLSWEEFIFSYTFSSSRAKPVSVGIALFLGEDANLWGAVMASAILMGFPILIFFLLAQNNFIKGVIGGAIKE
jgi:ABC-type glycerol-3-phosphate transport system permease component